METVDRGSLVVRIQIRPECLRLQDQRSIQEAKDPRESKKSTQVQPLLVSLVLIIRIVDRSVIGDN